VIAAAFPAAYKITNDKNHQRLTHLLQFARVDAA
jgi:hypothetical protein